MLLAEFNKLAGEGYRKIPLVKTILADLDTPVSAYLKLANKPYSYLFESVQGGEKWGRYSIIGLGSDIIIKVFDQQITVTANNNETHNLKVADPLAWIEEYQQNLKVATCEGLPAFTGGLVGYFGYESIRYIEPKLSINNLPDRLACPDILLMLSEEVLVFDNLSGKLHIVVHADVAHDNAYQIAEQRLSLLAKQLAQPLERHFIATDKKSYEKDFISEFGAEDFKSAVAKIKSYIVEGDVMQAVLSQRMSIDYDGSAFDLYRALRSLNPSPYMYYLDLGDFNIVGSSPEILVRLENDTVTVRPIAGTRKRGATEVEDKKMQDELLNDPKELAEHLMLIDLGRNDSGRISKTGSVRLTEKMVVEKYSHVMHIVSNVESTLAAGKSAMDVLRATFPAGTVSGAPKIRAMQIIHELEPTKRGVYAGAVGYLGWNGNLDTAIAIRTAIIKDQRLYIQAGAGVVHDSEPELEWKETMNKGRAIFKAVEMAQNSFAGEE